MRGASWASDKFLLVNFSLKKSNYVILSYYIFRFFERKLLGAVQLADRSTDRLC